MKQKYHLAGYHAKARNFLSSRSQAYTLKAITSTLTFVPPGSSDLWYLPLHVSIIEEKKDIKTAEFDLCSTCI